MRERQRHPPPFPPNKTPSPRRPSLSLPSVRVATREGNAFAEGDGYCYFITLGFGSLSNFSFRRRRQQQQRRRPRPRRRRGRLCSSPSIPTLSLEGTSSEEGEDVEERGGPQHLSARLRHVQINHPSHTNDKQAMASRISFSSLSLFIRTKIPTLYNNTKIEQKYNIPILPTLRFQKKVYVPRLTKNSLTWKSPPQVSRLESSRVAYYFATLSAPPFGARPSGLPLATLSPLSSYYALSPNSW